MIGSVYNRSGTWNGFQSIRTQFRLSNLGARNHQPKSDHQLTHGPWRLVCSNCYGRLLSASCPSGSKLFPNPFGIGIISRGEPPPRRKWLPPLHLCSQEIVSTSHTSASRTSCWESRHPHRITRARFGEVTRHSQRPRASTRRGGKTLRNFQHSAQPQSHTTDKPVSS